MWTPRRMLMVIAGLILFSGGFTVYSRLFGWIDGLPPLPDPYLTVLPPDGEMPTTDKEKMTPLQQRLRLAFGPNCLEQSQQLYKLKFESREKGILFAASDYKIMDDGRVQIQQMSVAIFGKTNKEMTTVHCDRAILCFDQPVRKIDDMGARKIKSAELYADPEYPTDDPRKGKVHIINNRKTLDPNDDLILLTPGPAYYIEDPTPGQPHIVTDAFIELTDRQNRPLPSQPEGEFQLPTVTAHGAKVYLTPAAPTAAGKSKKQDRKQANAVNGVDRIKLDHQVFMNLWTEGSNMFGGPDKSAGEKLAPPLNPAADKSVAPKSGAPALPAAPIEKTLVTIQTNGPFHYDAVKDIAHFEIPPKSDPNVQEFVRVVRHTKGNSEDTLTSDFLDVQFKRQHSPEPGAAKTATPAAPPPPKKAQTAGTEQPTAESQMEIETVHAWGESIALSSDQESLYAYGKDLIYDARIKQTILKGAPMHAVKEGNLIRSPELSISNFDDKIQQTMRARGPGIVGMGDFDPKTQEHSKQAHWRDWLVVTKMIENKQEINVITLTGYAHFVDTVNNQRLDGREIKLWLLGHDDAPAGKQTKKDVAKTVPKKASANAKTDDANKARPRRIEATGDVAVQSPDLIVTKSDYLNVWFKDVTAPLTPPVKAADAPGAPLAKDGAPPTNAQPNLNRAATGNSDVSSPPGSAKKKDSPAKKDEPEKKNPPIIVRHAARIEMWVNRFEGRNDLDKVHTVGNVVIHQDPSTESEKGIDLAGHTIDLQHYLDGNLLLVAGNEQVLGEVHFDKIDIIGDDIKIDQRDNTANVKGAGSMRMQSQASLIADGDKAKPPSAPNDKPQPPKYITIWWKDRMELEGAIRSVRYEGKVQAVQDDGRVLCEVMQVWLDRPLYLNQMTKPKDAPAPAKKGEPDNSPKVEQVLCDQMPPNAVGVKKAAAPPVSIEDKEIVDGVLKKWQNIFASEVKMDNRTNRMEGIGPGQVRMWQPGAKDPLADDPAGAPKKGPANPRVEPKNQPAKKDDAEEMKLYWVTFDKRMLAFNNAPKRSVFFNDVTLVVMPSDRHDVQIDVAKLPERALWLHCRESLEITTQSRKDRDKNGKEIEVKWQEMIAIEDVRIRSDNFDAWAGKVTYSEDKSLLVFYGTPKNPAVLKKSEQPGGERQTLRGKKITYNVKTKDVGVDDSVGAN